jgi:hypothetical protein
MRIVKYGIKPTGKLSSRNFAEVWGAYSESRSDKIYTVALSKKGAWSCGCPRWTRNASRPDCKHITYIKKFREQGFQVTEADAPAQVEKALSRFSSIEV